MVTCPWGLAAWRMGGGMPSMYEIRSDTWRRVMGDYVGSLFSKGSAKEMVMCLMIAAFSVS